MMKRTVWGVGLAGVAMVLLAPIWILWCPGAARWRTHLYQTMLYGHIAQRVIRDARAPEEVVERLAKYVYTHVWPATDVVPYDGKPLDYLVRGVGWCDYMAKIHMRLLATRHIPARYAMLLQTQELSPHTIAEVLYNGRWGAYDVLFNIRFVDPDGKPLTLEALSASPALLEAQPVVAMLRQQLPARAAQIRESYDKVLPVTIPPRRSKSATKTLTPFDHLVLCYAGRGGQRFVSWYQDRYLASMGWSYASTSDEALRLARHWHLAGRAALAKPAYLRCAQEHPGSPPASESRFWLGLLQWEVEDDAVGAVQKFQTLMVQDPTSRWMPMVWYYMGRCEETLDHLEQAHVWYAKAAEAGILAAALRVGRGIGEAGRATTAGRSR
ncbi:MAG: hypothetical protein HYZ92_06245, partial [Candidatus Omnitrophica bacterium]|nr:hypothetical protein [Candidatus Omnitrophota bacterium]